MMIGMLMLAASLVSVGEVRVDCPDPGSWRFKTQARRESNGVEIVSIRLDSNHEAFPPQFSVTWFTTQHNVHHVWSADSTHYGIPWGGPCPSELTSWLPVYSFIDANDGNRFTFACSESVRRVVFSAGISEERMGFDCACKFFTVPEAPLSSYSVELRFDVRDVFYAKSIGDASDWICRAADIEPMSVPQCAFDPLYSTWYTFHQTPTAELVEEECALASALGMKTLITDDGWQIDHPPGQREGGMYAYCGDWIPGRNFPDMREHVRRIHEMGMKYMVWFSVPFVGERSRNFERFQGKYFPRENTCSDGWVLDPRFPEVREFVVRTYEQAVREWDIDGLKLDFIGRFTLKGEDPAVREKYAGRDIKSIPLAVDAMLTEVMKRLRVLKPEILIEFRQPYIAPSIRRFGNMIRATDCPLSMVENRTRIARLRLTSGHAAVHSDMLEWRPDETAESAARFVLNSLFGVVQYSVRLKTLSENHRQMVAHWISFSQVHRAALVCGEFRPRHPASDYPLLEGECPSERIIGIYEEDLAVKTGNPDKPVYVLNGAYSKRILIDTAAAAVVTAYDTYGKTVQTVDVGAGVTSVTCPLSGYLKVCWK